MFVSFICMSGAFILAPVIYYPITGNRICMLPIYLPGVNWETDNFGYAITLIFQGVTCLKSIFQYSFSDTCFSLLVGHVTLMVDLIKIKLAELNHMIVSKEMTPTIRIRLHFRNILQMHKEMRL